MDMKILNSGSLYRPYDELAPRYKKSAKTLSTDASKLRYIENGLALEHFALDSDKGIRYAVLMQDFGYDLLKNDPEIFIRMRVAENPDYSNHYLNDTAWQVREAAAKHCKNPELFLNDADWHVRQAVATRGTCLDKLIGDSAWQVRKAVAEQGFGLATLCNDSNLFVQQSATKYGKTSRAEALRHDGAPLEKRDGRPQYVAFAMKTSGPSEYDDCILEICAVKVENGISVDTISIVVNDSCPINNALEQFESFLGNYPVVGYKNQSVDMRFWTISRIKLGLPQLRKKYIDLSLSSYKYNLPEDSLKSFALYCGFDMGDQSDTMSTAEAIVRCYEYLAMHVNCPRTLLDFGPTLSEVDPKPISEKPAKKRKAAQKNGANSIASRHGLERYVSFDFETTGLSRYNDDIIQVAAVKVENGIIVDEFCKLAQPNKRISPEATAIHRITNDMVRDASHIDTVLADFSDFISGYPVIGYNIASFDLPLWNSTYFRIGEEPLVISYLDLLPHAHAIPGLSDYKLTSVASHFGFDISSAHDALADSKMVWECYEHMAKSGVAPCELNQFDGSSLFSKKTTADDNANHQLSMFSHFKTKPSQETVATNILIDIAREMIKDEVISEEEFFELRSWLDENENLKGQFPYSEIANKVEAILSDGKVEPDELFDLEYQLELCIDPVQYARHDTIETLEGKLVVPTGDFKRFSKFEFETYVTKHGGIYSDKFTKKADYLVVGEYGSPAWTTGNYGTKIKKAMEYISKGASIQIVREADFVNEVTPPKIEEASTDKVTGSKKFIPISSTDTRELRKQLGLPITKGIRYMQKVLIMVDGHQVVTYREIEVIDYQVLAEYHGCEYWATLKITLSDGSTKNIHSTFLSDMQKPSFIEDMTAQSSF